MLFRSDSFYSIRNVNNLEKKPSTSELIDWIQALVIGGISPQKLKEEIPFLGVLLKKNEDLDLLLNQLDTGKKRKNRDGSFLNNYYR